MTLIAQSGSVYICVPRHVVARSGIFSEAGALALPEDPLLGGVLPIPIVRLADLHRWMAGPDVARRIGVPASLRCLEVARLLDADEGLWEAELWQMFTGDETLPWQHMSPQAKSALVHAFPPLRAKKADPMASIHDIYSITMRLTIPAALRPDVGIQMLVACRTRTFTDPGGGTYSALWFGRYRSALLGSSMFAWDLSKLYEAIDLVQICKGLPGQRVRIGIDSVTARSLPAKQKEFKFVKDLVKRVNGWPFGSSDSEALESRFEYTVLKFADAVKGELSVDVEVEDEPQGWEIANVRSAIRKVVHVHTTQRGSAD